MHEAQSPPTVIKKRKVSRGIENTEFVESDLLKSWKQVLGNPPGMGTTKVRILIIIAIYSQFDNF